jgi:hypothetical protein
MVSRLNRQLGEHGIEHYLFVEKAEYQRFCDAFADRVFIKPDGGDNGLGRGGSLVRWACHQKMALLVADDDTFANIDSDVYFNKVEVLKDVECGPGEVRGFAAREANCVDGRSFYHVSGMVLAACGDVFKRAVSLSYEDLYSQCGQIDRAGYSPSEDVTMSWLYQTRCGNVKIVNFHDKYTRGGYEADVQMCWPSRT